LQGLLSDNILEEKQKSQLGIKSKKSPDGKRKKEKKRLSIPIGSDDSEGN